MNWNGLWTEVRKHRDAFLFAGANLGHQFANVACQFVVLRFIAPGEMGVWQSVLVAEEYLLVTQFGVLNAMNREYPYYLETNDTETAGKVLQTAQAYALANGILLAIIFLLAGFIVFQGQVTWRSACFTVGAISVAGQYQNYLQGTFRSGHHFRALAWIRILQIPALGISLILPWALGFNGFCLRTILLSLLPLLLLHLARPVRVKPRFHSSALRLLVNTGWRLYIWSYIFRVAHSLPRLALLTYAGAGALGLFTPVLYGLQAFSGLSGSLSSYLYPVLTKRYARGNVVGHIAFRAAMWVVLGLAPVVAVGTLFVPPMLNWALPQYAQCAAAVCVSLAAGLMECMSVATISFGAMKAWRAMFLYLGAALTVRGVCSFTGAVFCQDPVMGVAYGMFAASVIMVPVTFFTTRLADVDTCA